MNFKWLAAKAFHGLSMRQMCESNPVEFGLSRLPWDTFRIKQGGPSRRSADGVYTHAQHYDMPEKQLIPNFKKSVEVSPSLKKQNKIKLITSNDPTTCLHLQNL